MVKISLAGNKVLYRYGKNQSAGDASNHHTLDLTHSSEGNWMHFQTNFEGPILNTNELISLTALIAYVASKTGTAEFRVERNLADRFNIPNVKRLPAEQYDAAICYLVDQIEPQPSQLA